MKASVITAITLAATAMAGPLQLVNRNEDCSCEYETVVVTIPAPIETPCSTDVPTEPTTEPTAEPTVEPTGEPTVSVPTTIPTVIPTPSPEPTETPTATETETPSPTPTGGCEEGHCHGTGPLLDDLAPQANRLLTVTGTDGKSLLISIDEDLYNLLEGKVSLSDSIGEIVGDAAQIGTLLSDLAPIIDCIITIVGDDLRILLVRLAPEVAELVKGVLNLGQESVSSPVGRIIPQGSGLGLKRDAPGLGALQSLPVPKPPTHMARVTDKDNNTHVVGIEGALGELLASLHLSGIVGTVLGVGESVFQLVADLGPDVEGLVLFVGKDVRYILVQLTPTVTELVGTLLPALKEPVGEVLGSVTDFISEQE